MSLLSGGEVLKFAVKIEENGLHFYRIHAQRFSGTEAGEIFAVLADDEARHRDTFQRMLARVDDLNQPTSYPDEYFTYLQAYADNLVFSKMATGELSTIRDAQSAVDFGIQREADSILYYQEIRSFVPQKDRHLVNSILAEERKHFAKLSQIRVKL